MAAIKWHKNGSQFTAIYKNEICFLDKEHVPEESNLIGTTTVLLQ